MLHFARRSQWLLPLMLLLTVVIIQVCAPAGGSERGSQRSSRSKAEELEEYEGGDYETEAPLEDMLETEHGETVTARSRKPFRSYYNRKSFLLLPALLVGIAAAYAAAGYVSQRHGVAPEGRWSLFSRKRDGAPGGWFPWLSRGRRKPPEASGEGFQQLVQLGKRALAPAAALALAIGAASVIYNQHMLGGGFFGDTAYPNSTTFERGPFGSTGMFYANTTP